MGRDAARAARHLASRDQHRVGLARLSGHAGQHGHPRAAAGRRRESPAAAAVAGGAAMSMLDRLRSLWPAAFEIRATPAPPLTVGHLTGFYDGEVSVRAAEQIIAVNAAVQAIAGSI